MGGGHPQLPCKCFRIIIRVGKCLCKLSDYLLLQEVVAVISDRFHTGLEVVVPDGVEAVVILNPAIPLFEVSPGAEIDHPPPLGMPSDLGLGGDLLCIIYTGAIGIMGCGRKQRRGSITCFIAHPPVILISAADIEGPELAMQISRIDPVHDPVAV